MDLNVWIYDVEVFEKDFVIVFKSIENGETQVIHNNNDVVKEFIENEKPILGGFNNKHFDDWILLNILKGGTPEDIKSHSDFIMNGGRGWEYERVQYTKKPFKSFDLKDDTVDPALSLKAIEGNLNKRIVESEISFDINRKLTGKELSDVINYCTYDVDSTCDLYNARLDNYIKPKLLIADMYGLDPAECIGLTNAKLSAKVLGAKYTSRSDERDYKIPPQINLDDIPQPVLDFFNQIHDKSIPDEKLFSSSLELIFETSKGECPITYAYGGVHGAKTNVIVESTKDKTIVNYDVASLYPLAKLNFGYCSRSMADPESYRNLVNKRLAYKQAGDKQKSDALKLVVKC